MAIKPLVTIMPDYGNAWAWTRDDEVDPLDSGYVGPNNGYGRRFFHENLSISPELLEAFLKWQSIFEGCREPGKMDWKSFHEAGLQLARRFKEEVGDSAIVRYMKPGEDPDCETDEIIVFE